jgi:putative flippase GtrA
MSQKTLSETKQVGKFGLVGLINTLIDFSLYNLFINILGVPLTPLKLILANLISTTSAMTFSFIANKTFVFKFKQGNILRQVGLYFLSTAFGLYAIQNGVIYILTEIWLWPLDFAYQIAAAIGLDNFLSKSFFIANGAKAIATLFSLVWNYLMYKKVVFKIEKRTQ